MLCAPWLGEFGSVNFAGHHDMSCILHQIFHDKLKRFGFVLATAYYICHGRNSYICIWCWNTTFCMHIVFGRFSSLWCSMTWRAMYGSSSIIFTGLCDQFFFCFLYSSSLHMSLWRNRSIRMFSTTFISKVNLIQPSFSKQNESCSLLMKNVLKHGREKKMRVAGRHILF